VSDTRTPGRWLAEGSQDHFGDITEPTLHAQGFRLLVVLAYIGRVATPSRARGPYAVSAGRREQILRTALASFAVKGYRAASIREIAAQVGLTDAGVLYHFGSKEKLLEAVLEQRDTAYTDLFANRTHGLAVLDAVQEVMARNARQPGLVRLFCTLSAEAMDPEHPAHAFFVRRYMLVRQLFADCLANGQASGEIKPEVDVEQVASTLIAVQDGLQGQWLLDERLDMVRAFADFLTLLRSAIAVPEAAIRA
jgi:AcrR family transcriptional regulator